MKTIQQVENNIHYSLLKHMLYDYICEMHKYNANVKLRTADELAVEYFYSPCTDFYLILNGNDEEPAGFMIIGYGKNCHSSADIYIEEFYIKPKYRRKGLGSKAINEFLEKNNIKDVCFFIEKGNDGAKAFWKTIFKDWCDSSLICRDTSDAPDWLEWKFYNFR